MGLGLGLRVRVKARVVVRVRVGIRFKVSFLKTRQGRKHESESRASDVT